MPTNSLQDRNERLSITLAMLRIVALSMCAVPLLFLIHAIEELARDWMKEAEAQQKPSAVLPGNILMGTALAADTWETGFVATNRTH